MPLLLPALQVIIQQPGMVSQGWVFRWKPGWCWLWHWFMYRWQGQLFHNDCRYHWEPWTLRTASPSACLFSLSALFMEMSVCMWELQWEVIRWVRLGHWNCCWISQFGHIHFKPSRSLSARCSIRCQHRMNAQVTTFCMVKSWPKWSQWELPVVFHEAIILNFSIFKSLSHFLT